jgi:hypothetical protein
MLTILFIVGRTTLFTPVDINLEQIVDFLNFYACSIRLLLVMGDTTSIGFDTIPITFWLKYRGIDYPNDYFLQFSK